jgi:hypothetical protein
MTPFAILGFVLLAAHALRGDGIGAALFWLLAAFLPFVRGAWRHQAMAGLLLLGALLWGEVTFQLVGQRLALALPWVRLAVILGGVTLLTLAAALMQWRGSLKAGEMRTAPALAFLLIIAVLAVARQKASLDIVLFDRFSPGAGWPEIFLLGLYGAWLVGKMEGDNGGRWRRVAWAFFSVVFFVQLGLGLLGLHIFLMTGKLHLPIPALIAAGPLYRGEGLFMIILFVTSVSGTTGRPRGGHGPGRFRGGRGCSAGG